MHPPMKHPTPTEQHESLDMALMCLHHVAHDALVQCGNPDHLEPLDMIQGALDVMYEHVEEANGRRLEPESIGLN